MGVSLIDIIKEEARETATGDDQFFVKAPYLFVLRGPDYKGPLGFGGSAQFPLPVNPTEITYRLPFAAEVTPLQQGGVTAEEGGICIGEISIDASMGFKPRKDRSTAMGPGDGDFTGLMGASGLLNQELSGQMHFWRLANRCFDAYSALKKDPDSAHKTSLEFHSIRDQLHLTVIPREFSLRRSVGKERVSYRMTCQLAVVGPAAKVVWFSPDKDLISKIKDTISQIRAGIQAVSAVIDDITAAIDEIRRTITSVVSILDDITSVTNAFSGLIDGTKKFLDIPRSTLVSLTENCEAMANTMANVVGWPADAVQAGRALSDQLDRLNVAATNYFTESWDRQVERYRQRVNGAPLEVNSKSFGVNADAPGTGLTTFSVVDVFGGGEKPGDARRAANLTDDGRLVAGQYQGFTEKVVGQGDTLQSLAARHLGDARKWVALAIVNDLRPPYVTDQAAIPNTIRVGDKVVIPVSAPQPSPDTITTGNPKVGESQAEENLGTDYYFTQLNAQTWGWQIDVAGGSVDILKVKGIANISQAIGARFRTEQGENILYPAIGLPRAIGMRGTPDAFTSVRYAAREQLLADKRIERLGRFSLTVVADKVQLEADVQPVGFSSLRTISRTLT